jgi:hypothetical protein
MYHRHKLLDLIHVIIIIIKVNMFSNHVPKSPVCVEEQSTGVHDDRKFRFLRNDIQYIQVVWVYTTFL